MCYKKTHNTEYIFALYFQIPLPLFCFKYLILNTKATNDEDKGRDNRTKKIRYDDITAIKDKDIASTTANDSVDKLLKLYFDFSSNNLYNLGLI